MNKADEYENDTCQNPYEYWEKLYLEGLEIILAQMKGEPIEECAEESIKKSTAVLTEEDMIALCDEFGFESYMNVDGLHIRTNCGNWKIRLDGEQVCEVYHGNYRNVKFYKNADKYIDDVYQKYHKQSIDATNLRDVLKYIYYHDKNLLTKKKVNLVDDVLYGNQEKYYLKMK